MSSTDMRSAPAALFDFILWMAVDGDWVGIRRDARYSSDPRQIMPRGSGLAGT